MLTLAIAVVVSAWLVLNHGGPARPPTKPPLTGRLFAVRRSPGPQTRESRPEAAC